MGKKVNLLRAILLSSMVLFVAAMGCKKMEEKKEIKSFDMAAAQKSIDSCRTAFTEAFNKGDAAGVAACYFADAKFMPPNTPAKVGTEAIKAEIEGYFKNGVTKLELKSTGLWGDENLLSEESTWSIFDKDGKELDHGKALVTYQKEGGTWKLLRDCYNSDMPCTPPSTSAVALKK